MRRPGGSGPAASLLAWKHQVGGRRAGIHDPDAAHLGAVGKTERGSCRSGYRDREVRAGGRLVLAHQVVENRAELRLGAGAILFSRVERGLALGSVGLRLEPHVLRDAIDVADAAALDGKRQLPGESRLVEAQEAV